ncbi:hypothetical protein L2734_16365 [Parashewanella spongiae]|uniref:TolB family protein n=1 Tax=Parashewanella spongiae TaxID=342950 RepID=UPI001FB3616F|nr:hypothetical protein [Parashewanella spongiae]MCL1079717.1 hypothetical protein [Parashewanella spongiae]
MKSLTLSVLLTSTVQAAGYDIVLYPLSFDSETSSWSLGKGKMLTNREGYDNQASFTQDSKGIVFSSNRNANHNDIYRYNIEANTFTQLTNTPDESEFSPTDTASGLQYVVEQAVPRQSVWVKQAGQARQRAIKSYIPAGYYATHPELGTLIWARYAYSLYFEPKGQEANEGHFTVANAGRSLHVVPNSKTFSYLLKKQDGDRQITQFDPLQNSHRKLVSLDSGSEDYAWSGQQLVGSPWIFNASDDGLFAWQLPETGLPSAQTGWQKVTSLVPPSKDHKMANRIAVSPNNRYITIVWSRK